VSRQVDRLEDVNTDSRAAGIKNQCRVSKAGTPASIDEPSVDVAGQLAAFEPVELMTVGTTRRKRSIGRQAMEGRVQATPTVSPAPHRPPSSHCTSLADGASGLAGAAPQAGDAALVSIDRQRVGQTKGSRSKSALSIRSSAQPAAAKPSAVPPQPTRSSGRLSTSTEIR